LPARRVKKQNRFVLSQCQDFSIRREQGSGEVGKITIKKRSPARLTTCGVPEADCQLWLRAIAAGGSNELPVWRDSGPLNEPAMVEAVRPQPGDRPGRQLVGGRLGLHCECSERQQQSDGDASAHGSPSVALRK